ncbi:MULTISPECIES: ferredoxin--NADP reductase [unclassified Lysobacter]|uniref:ferredoxin--NADP reductase n=1 Tax=unclassified Lysobacter TaxID=2635362 RepID=UPI001BEC1093|nr:MULTISPECIES: ferredoxin--NADP reductase [unclassified Lysobacter]MBT2750156.1 ferredoxin--NADP reductase [Lysobacter sp. ISL-50]MBT2775273.1 ferredoxin--NADP reductase [Lysobacter sp. ISL-54]MBT2782646.1 ferredoxin--NADP reductase [Lysobacter sp. ISL-52]
MKQFPLKLVSRRMLAPSVGHYVFLRDDGEPLDYIPGQFIQIHFQYADGTATKRSYSLATIHDHALGPGEEVEIAVSYVPGGAATALFEGLNEGDPVLASGPFGRFCLMPGDANQRYLLIGTGTGVTPYRAMLPQLQALIRERGIQVVLLFGARTPDELLYGDEFRAFADREPNFRFVPCFSRELPEQPHADVRRGYVQQFLDEFAPDANGDIAYLCGNPNMVDACFEALKGHGLAVPQIRREKYVSSK